MKKINAILLLIVGIFLFTSCSDDDTIGEARKMTLTEITNTPDYFWFSYEYEQYKLDTAWLKNIIAVQKPDEYKFVVYTEPSCLCGTDYTYFPKFIKLLDSAGIMEDNYEIYLMSDTNNLQPYSQLYKVEALPSIILLHNGQFIYSVTDSMKAHSTTLEEEIIRSFYAVN
ncbi:MAG: hypothetical protein LBO69_01200 [Ignavibacteria bacterium]|jgi:hypothetical protein|nr:hypothetical protein [Ignavibacteria bacterium]